MYHLKYNPYDFQSFIEYYLIKLKLNYFGFRIILNFLKFASISSISPLFNNSLILIIFIHNIFPENKF